MPDAMNQGRRPAAWSFILAGWILAIGLGVLLVAVHAQHTKSMKYFTPLLLMAIWLASGTLVAVGTFRVTAFLKNVALRIVVTALVVFVQCWAYYPLYLAIAIQVYLWAGGNL